MNNVTLPPLFNRTVAEIDLDAAEYNFNALKAMSNGKMTCAVIKANAYGHGALRLARLYSELGVDFFAVAGISEAKELRYGGIKEPILVLGYIPPESATLAADLDITVTVYSLDFAKQLSGALKGSGKTLKFHLKFDTGMGRLGFIPAKTGENALPDALDAINLPSLILDGAFTHFAVADGGDDAPSREFTQEQARRFSFAMDYLKSFGIVPRVKHVSNSAATLDYPHLAIDMVRLGISLYGLCPSFDIKNPFSPKPVMTLKSVISHIKTISRGDSVSYGRTFTAEKSTRVATVPLGYADGFFRSSSQNGVTLTVGDKAVPILGRVCMDQLMIDVTDTEAELFCEVRAFGSGAFESADSYADKNGTIGYEATCAVGKRVPRVYIRHGAIDSFVDYLE